jgi:uncharacterized protein YjbI with pentapeptide repeats
MSDGGTTRTIHDMRITLPGEEPAHDIEEFTRLPRTGELIADSRIAGDTWRRASLDGVKISRCWLKGADLGSTTIVNVEMDRCAFAGCSLIGARWEGGIVLRNVLFENCRLDYASLTSVRAAGPVAFVGCSLSETSFDRSQLRTAVFDGCKLSGMSMESCDLRGADLRNNDLSGLATPTALRGARLSQAQLPGLLDALVAELSIALVPEPLVG